MNWLDILILVLLAVAAIVGLKMGIIKAVLSIVGLVIGIILAVRYYVPLSERLTLISSETGAKITAFAIILVGVLIVARLVAWGITKLASVLMMEWINRIAGAILCMAIIALVISAIMALGIRLFGPSDTINNSALAKGLLSFFPWIMSIIPQDKIPGL
jgi:membrane protein required for colicin V production